MAKRRRRNKKWLKAILFLILIIVAGVVCFLVWDSYFKDDNSEVESEVIEQPIVEQGKTEAESEVEESVEVVEKEEVLQYDGADPNESVDLTGVITYTNVANGVLTIRVNIDQYISSGSCELILVRGGAEIYSETVQMIDSASTSTCKGFDISMDGLGSGSTSIIINLSGDNKNGVISGEVVL